jgi:hypothetical protein
MADGTIALTTEGGQTFSQHYYSYMDTGRSNLAVRAGSSSCARAWQTARRVLRVLRAQHRRVQVSFRTL